MRIALLITFLAASSLFAFVLRPQSAEFIGRVISAERCSSSGWDTTHTNLWKAVVTVEKIEKLNLYIMVTNLTDEVAVYYDQADLLKTNSTYRFLCFTYPGDDTNRVSLSVFGGRVTGQ